MEICCRVDEHFWRHEMDKKTVNFIKNLDNVRRKYEQKILVFFLNLVLGQFVTTMCSNINRLLKDLLDGQKTIY